MWTELPVGLTVLPCQPPFSFYYLVEAVWKSERYAEASVALNRICTLARKMEAKTALLESVLWRPDLREEINDLDAFFGGGGAAEGFAISFFDEELVDGRLANVDDDRLLGQVVIINYRRPGSPGFDCTYIYESVLRAPHLRRIVVESERVDRVPLLNNYLHCQRAFEVTVCGRTFSLESAVFYCQQNAITSACAHACLMMGLNSMNRSGRLTTRTINNELKIAPPFEGLSLQQVSEILANRGYKPYFFAFGSNHSPEQYVPTLYSVIESGYPALLVFTTASERVDHVVPVFGHTLNSDEWHPQAIPAYSGPPDARFYQSSSWSDHFLIHDDNFGPYYCLSPSCFSVPGEPKASPSEDGEQEDHGEEEIEPKAVRPSLVIALFPDEVKATPTEVEGVVSSWLRQSLPTLRSMGTGRWWEYVLARDRNFVVRTLLVTRDQYALHLRNATAHDGTCMEESELQFVTRLPERFWLSEFTLPNLYAGNKSKLGEVLVSSTKPVFDNNLFASVIGMRAPGFFVHWDGGTNPIAFHSSIQAHCGLFRRDSREEPFSEW